jgi:hypothetical protein
MKRIIALMLVVVLSMAFTSLARGEETSENKDTVKPKYITLTHQDLELTGETKKLYDLFFKIADPRPSDSKQNRLQQAQLLLSQAASIATDEGQKNYLQVLAEDLGKKDFSASSGLWMGLEGQTLDFFVKFRRKQRKIDPYIVYYDNEATKTLDSYRNATDRMLDLLNVKREYIDNLGRFMAPIQVGRLLFAPKIRRFVLMVPSRPVKEKRPGFKLLVFRNVLDEYFKNVLQPVAKQLLVGAWAAAVDEEAFFRYVTLQKIGHYIGPVLIADKSGEIQTVSASIGKTMVPLEMIKSHVLAVRCVPFLVEDEVIPKEDEKKLLALYVTYLVDKLRHAPSHKGNLPYLAQFNLLLEKGAIGFDIQKKKFYIDIPSMKSVLSQMSTDVLTMIQKGRAKAVKKFFDRYREVPSELEGVLEALSRMPLQVEIATSGPSN